MADSLNYNREALESALDSFQLVPVHEDFERRKAAMIARIDELLATNFDKLISILYRLDINEKVLRERLAIAGGTDSALIITDMIIARQIEKIHSRRSFRSTDPIDEEEKW